MKVEMTHCTPNPEQVIGESAAICYDSEIDLESNSTRLRKMMEYKHYSPLRFANATFTVSGISRACSHQLVRLAHAGVLQQSQRYVLASELGNVLPESFAKASDTARHLADIAIRTSRDAYNMLIDEGVPKEDARYLLTESVVTQMVITANFQAWRHFLKARLGKGAQWEIKAVAREIHAYLHAQAPIVFGDLNGNS